VAAQPTSTSCFVLSCIAYTASSWPTLDELNGDTPGDTPGDEFGLKRPTNGPDARTMVRVFGISPVGCFSKGPKRKCGDSSSHEAYDVAEDGDIGGDSGTGGTGDFGDDGDDSETGESRASAPAGSRAHFGVCRTSSSGAKETTRLGRTLCDDAAQ